MLIKLNSMQMIRLLQKHGLRWTVVTISVFITLSLASYHLFQAQRDHNSFIKRLDFLFYDWRYNLMLDNNRFPRAEENIVIVDIDEQSLETEGRWPWSRDKIARMVENLANAGAVVIGFDVLMTEPQLNPTRELQKKALAIGRTDIAGELESFVDETEYDQILANSFGATDIILPFLFHDNAQIQVGQLPEPVYRIPEDLDNDLFVITANGFTANIPILQDAAIGAGFIVPSIDGDGVLRSAPIVQRFGDNIYPSFSLAIGMAYMFVEDIEPTLAPLTRSTDFISKIDFVGEDIYTDIHGRVLVPYLGPSGEFPYISAGDVYQNRISEETFENAIVLIGTSSVGLADLRSTPVGTQYPGVEVHANLLNGLLEGVFPVEPVEANTLIAVLLLILGFLFTAFSNRLGPFQLTVATLALLITLVSINLYLWFSLNVALPLASSFILTLALGTLHLLEGFLSERRAKQHVTSVFGQYVPSAHISHMLNDPEKYGFQGEHREMTVLFSDIRSFTTISENLSATELKDLLNRYFTPITETIFKNQGTIDKYVGDMVMAFWGAPLEDPKHAQHALQASIEMLEVLDRLNPQLKELGYPEIQVGIGLNSGPMNVGDMGSSFRRAYTVLGDAVNLGSRLESLTKFYGAKILVGAQTAQQCPDWTFRFVDKIQVKGKHEPVNVYEPLCLTKKLNNAEKDELTEYARIYELYLNQQWDDARTGFEKLLETTDRPNLYQIYLDRIDLLSWQPLPDDWDGTFTHTSK